jgi:hypothetical protein
VPTVDSSSLKVVSSEMSVVESLTSSVVCVFSVSVSVVFEKPKLSSNQVIIKAIKYFTSVESSSEVVKVLNSCVVSTVVVVA